MEEEFLLKLSEAYTKYDASIIDPYLADDMHYASMWGDYKMTLKYPQNVMESNINTFGNKKSRILKE